MKKETMFAENKSFSDVLVEGLLFAMGSVTAMCIVLAFVLAVQNI